MFLRALPFQLLASFNRFLDRADHEERLLRDIVQLTFEYHLKAFYRVSEFYVFALDAGECLSHKERLREEFLYLPRADDSQFVLVGKLVDTEYGYDILQILISLEDLLNVSCRIIMVLAQDPGVEYSRGRIEGIDRRIYAEVGYLTR